MTAKYYVTLTQYGAELVAAAHDLQSIELTQLVIGDANGVPYQPIDQTNLTQLVHQTAAVNIREIKVVNNTATVSAIIPANVGGFNIHEIGLKDASGKLVYIGNYHGAYKPVIAEGGGGELELVIDIKATAGAQALIEIDPLIISASKTWVLEKFNELLEAINNKEDIKVDDLFITTSNFANSDAVAAHKKYGVWERFGDGHALVSQATASNDLAPAFMKTISAMGGSNTQKLTIDHLPAHDHDFVDGWPGSSSSLPENSVRIGNSDGYANDDAVDSLLLRKTRKIGANENFSIVQNSIIVAVWLRIA